MKAFLILMKCVKCGRSASVRVQNLNTCEACFIKIIEKRVRKELRINKLIEKNNRVLIIDDGTASSKVAQYMLPRIIKDMPIILRLKQIRYSLGAKIKGMYDKIILPWSVDQENEYFLSCIFQNKKPKYLGHYTLGSKKYVKMLLPLLESEIKLFAKINNLEFHKQAKSSYTQLLNKLESFSPELKFSLLKASRMFIN